MVDYKVAIIGAGFCGTMVAVHLARLMPYTRIALIDRKTVGLGLAYGTIDPDHLLNVRTANMGAFADDPGHFYTWLQQQADLNFSEQDFAPRMVYGRYMTDLLTQSRAVHSELAILSRSIVNIRRLSDRFELMSHDGQALTAERVVLALGNFPADQHSIMADDMNPYAPETWKKLAGPDDILIIGTGLTSLDLIVTLSKTKSAGRIHLLSRHGLLPREHTEPRPYTLKLKPPYPTTALGICRALRNEIDATPDTPWQSIIDALRPLNQLLWQSLNSDERRRFLRHLRAYWDVHRHRCAPQIMDIYRNLVQAGRLTLHKGLIIKQTLGENSIDIVWRPRGKSSLETLTVQKIVRCTGPQADFRKLSDPLVQNLLATNLLVADKLNLGVVSENYSACDSNGHAVKGLYVLGSLLRGKLYESIAVPELRQQAADVAQILAKEINP